MPEIWIPCDRCGLEFRCNQSFMIHSGQEVLLGGYRFEDSKGNPTIWEEFGLPGEEFACNKCVRTMPAFMAKYPHATRMGIT